MTDSKNPRTIAGDPTTDSTVLSGPPRMAPTRLGKYALIERLGVGGMAEVYLAEQAGVAGFAKKVVVKRILPHLAADAQFVQMFVREAKVAARVAHPNVVQIFELAEEGGEIFIAMEHIDGLTLHRLAAAAWEQGRALPIDVVIRTIADAALGLHAAHSLTDEDGNSLHLVHRDVSPDNLMVSKDGVTKVLDFGIAKGDLGGPKTKTGNLRGKIPFMPPEQIQGLEIDGRTDLYALGVSAYWMLTGERPFDRQSDWHTMQAILTDPPRPASALNPGVPPALDALLLRMMQKDRAHRPASGREVAELLEDLASPTSVGGKKTTIAFLSTVLPSTNARGNPVSEVRPTAIPKPPASVVSQTSPPMLEPMSLPNQTLPFVPPPPPPPPQAMSLAQPPVAVVARTSAPGATGPSTGNETPVVQPVTSPAGKNAISDVLAPQRSGVPVGVVVGGLVAVVLVAVAIVAFVVVPAIGAGKGTADAGVVVDAGVKAPVLVDAGVKAVVVVDAGVKAVVAPVAQKSVRIAAPTRIRWKLGDVVLGVGSGNVSVPGDTSALVAEDTRRAFSVSVPIENGAADFAALPTGTVILVRKSDSTTILLGDDDVSLQRKIQLPAGRYLFKVKTKTKQREVPVEVQVGKTHTVDGAG